MAKERECLKKNLVIQKKKQIFERLTLLKQLEAHPNYFHRLFKPENLEHITEKTECSLPVLSGNHHIAQYSTGQ